MQIWYNTAFSNVETDSEASCYKQKVSKCHNKLFYLDKMSICTIIHVSRTDKCFLRSLQKAMKLKLVYRHSLFIELFLFFLN